ncbi:hypothetical protein [Streptomyces cyaneofuscatus]|uniref:hypothetical protein n=1 Tax=Streptomyces cyaneofuscatus TaxID=66883 RepID=UPI0036626152
MFPDATPALCYDRSDTSDPTPGEPYHGVPAVADHVGDALTNPGSTFPTKSGKTLPGGEPLHPMHRLVPGPEHWSRAAMDANRSAVTATCNSPAMPGRPGPDDELDCDEFPMAPTSGTSTESRTRKQDVGWEPGTTTIGS